MVLSLGNLEWVKPEPLPTTGKVSATKSALRVLEAEQRLNTKRRHAEDSLERRDDFGQRRVRRIELVGIDENAVAGKHLIVRARVGLLRNLVPVDRQDL